MFSPRKENAEEEEDERGRRSEVGVEDSGHCPKVEFPETEVVAEMGRVEVATLKLSAAEPYFPEVVTTKTVVVVLVVIMQVCSTATMHSPTLLN